MKLPKILPVILAVLAAAPFAAVAQTEIADGLDLGGFSGRIFSDEALFRLPGPAFADMAAAPALPWFAIGQFVGTDDMDIGGGTFGYRNALRKGSLPFSLSFGYQSLNPDGPGESLEQYSFKYQQTLHVVPDRYALKVATGYKDLRSFRKSYDATLSSEMALSKIVSLTTNVGWAIKDPEDGERIDGVVPSAALGFSKDKLNVSLEYTFDNGDISDEDYAAYLSFTLPRNMNLTIGAAKDNVMVGQYRVRF